MNHLFPIALEHLPNPTLIIASNRQILFANIVAINMFDIIIGKNVALTFRHPDVLSAINQAFETKTAANVEFSILGPMALIFELHATPISNEPGAQFVLLSLQDKTKAVRSEEMRADFVANVSHELRSPLSSILGFIETLQGPASDDKEAHRKFLTIMGREAVRMNRLIDNLLQLSQVEIDEHILPCGKVDVVANIQNVLEVLETRAVSKGITLDLIGADQPSLIKGDTDQLNQVFMNLIENAIHYGNSNSIVQIVIDQLDNSPLPESGIAIHIKDISNGIEKRHIPRLSERFYHVDTARTHHANNVPVSTGLGLAIVKHIVNRHRGHFKVESKIGVGSTFSIFLPTNIS